MSRRSTPVTQPRCVYCLREHYVVGVIAISLGQAGCHHCGRTPPVYYSTAEYRRALMAARCGRDDGDHSGHLKCVSDDCHGEGE